MKDWDAVEADVDKILSVHYSAGRSGYSINKIVVHYNAADLTVEGCYSVWQSREASAHYQVESSGRIGQLVWDSDTAWHAGNWSANCSSIGIEHANRADGTIAEKCLDNGAHLVASLCKLYKLGRPQWLKNVFPHSYFSATSCPGQIYGSQKSAYIKRAQQWYDYMTGSGSKPSSSGSTGSSAGGSASTGSNLKPLSVKAYYALKTGSAWWPTVTDFNNSNDDGYAGAPFVKHRAFRAKVSKGSIRYRCHDTGTGKWTAWKKDWQICEVTEWIDGIQCYYTTPDGYEYKQAWYRSQTTHRTGWLDTCCDDGTTYDEYDGWAGMYDEPLDRFQLAVRGSNPF